MDKAKDFLRWRKARLAERKPRGQTAWHAVAVDRAIRVDRKVHIAGRVWSQLVAGE